eukprot:jgi/Mesen1/5797/ME000293S04949
MFSWQGHITPIIGPATSTFSSQDGECSGNSVWSYASLGLLAAGSAALGVQTFTGDVAYADEAEHGLPPPKYPWPHKGVFDAYDHASIRRGHQVYQNVCMQCHSLGLVTFRDLVGVAYTTEEVKEMASEVEVLDGPNEEGEMYYRPGKPSDKLPSPYANEEAARAANGGAYPPDLSAMVKARHDREDYLFALLTGYREPPEGVKVMGGLYYNPYFPGGAIAMPKMLNDGGVEYDDGTPATESQMAKDVTSFLAWASEPEMEERKLAGAKWMVALILLQVTAVFFKRWRWSPVKSRRVVVDVVH